MTCPARDLGMNVLSNISCKPNPVFVWRQVQLPMPVQQIYKAIVSLASCFLDLVRSRVVECTDYHAISSLSFPNHPVFSLLSSSVRTQDHTH